jgi:hypothetical protein
VGEHDRVVVAVDDPGVGRDPLGDLVQVRLGGYAGADVQELPYALLGQPPRGAVHERAVDPGHHRHPGFQGRHLPAHRLVDRVVVLAAEVPVVHPRGMRLAGVDLDGCRIVPCHAALHRRRTRWVIKSLTQFTGRQGC